MQVRSMLLRAINLMCLLTTICGVRSAFAGGPVFKSLAITQPEGVFQVDYDIVPGVSPGDVGVGLSAKVATQYTDMGPIVRLGLRSHFGVCLLN